MYPNLIKEHWRMSTCNRLDLQTLGSQQDVYARNSPRITARSNLVVTWKVRSQMGHCFKISPRVALVLPWWLYIDSSLQLVFQVVLKKQEKEGRKEEGDVVLHIKSIVGINPTSF